MSFYDKYLKMELWALWQGIYLILGKEPRLSDFMNKFVYGTFEKKFDDIVEIALSSIKCGSLKMYVHSDEGLLYSEVKSDVFLSWSKKKNLLVEPLLNLFQEEPVDLPLIMEEKEEKNEPIPTIKKTHKRNRSISHPEFMSYVKFYVRQDYTAGDYLKMMIDARFVFAEEKKYIPNENNTDNSYEHIKNVALINNGLTKNGKQNYRVYYKTVLNDENKLGKTKSISLRTVEDYFYMARREPHVNYP